MRRLRSLDMVRAVAAVLVILFHAGALFKAGPSVVFLHRTFGAGYRGVDLFFVLSGFVIAYAHAGDVGHAARLPNYVFNRAARIFPALWIMSLLALGTYAAGFGGAEGADKLSPYSIAASFLLLPQQGPPLVNVSWTLTYELFFYGLFALLLVNLRAGLIVLVLWQGAIAVLALSGGDPESYGYYLRDICLEFGVGLVCAWWVVRNGAVDRPGLWWPLLATGVALFAGGMAADEALGFAGVLCAAGGGAAILALVQLELAGRIRAPAALVAIGGASYAIYLVHFSVLSVGAKIAARLGMVSSDWFALLFVAVGLAGGFAFDRLIDRPIQRGLRKLKPHLVRPTGARAPRGSLGSAPGQAELDERWARADLDR